MDGLEDQLKNVGLDAPGNEAFIKMLHPYISKLTKDDRLQYMTQFLELLRHYINKEK